MPEENLTQNNPTPEATPEPTSKLTESTPTSPETPTAQFPPIEPLTAPAEPQIEPINPIVSTPEPAPEARNQTPPATNNPILAFLNQAKLALQNKKRKKLDRIMALFSKQSQITNNEVEKLLHISDATATRYLSILEKEGRIKQNGKTGRHTSYSKQ